MSFLSGSIFVVLFFLLTLALVASKAVTKYLVYVNDPVDALSDLELRFVSAYSHNVLEKVLYNIVEEMALAEQLPVPKICILDSDASINSFVIGSNPNDAIIGVTEGFLECLTRKEMQAVLAFQLSKISKDEIKLDLILLAIVNSLNTISSLGEIILMRWDKHHSKTLKFIGLAIKIFGSVGIFLSMLVKIFGCRKRIFEADRTSTEIMHETNTLAKVLRKIGALNFKSGYGVLNELGLLFFAGNSCPRLDSRSAAHPSIKRRIKKIDPTWKGDFPMVKRLQFSNFKCQSSVLDLDIVCLEMEDDAKEHIIAMLDNGEDSAKLILSREVLQSIPDAVILKIRDPHSVRGLMLAMLIDANQVVEEAQMKIVLDTKNQSLYQEVVTARMLLKYLKSEHYVALIRLANPTLRGLTRKEFDEFTVLVRELIAADHKVSLFEYCIYQMLLPVQPVIRSMMSYEEAKNILLKSLRDEDFVYSTVDKAVKAVARVEEKRKRILVSELIKQIAEDGVVTPFEMQYMSAICSAIGYDALSN